SPMQRPVGRSNEDPHWRPPACCRVMPSVDFRRARMKLYTYWRSLATFRVRIALNLKGLAYDPTPIHLHPRHHPTSPSKALNPQLGVRGLVEYDGNVLFQSMAIMEYLDETYPEPPLLPADPRGRARVRSLSLITVADSHPLIVPRVRTHLGATFNLD